MSTHPRVRFLDRTTPPHVMTLVALAGLPALTINIFLPSLPNMAVHFDTDYAVMQLSVATYLAANAVMQLFVGPISDRYGRRPVLLISTVLFLLATLGCIFAPSAEAFLGFRMAQAVVVTAMVLSRAVVRDMVADTQAASMIGYVTMGMALVPMIGPSIGGVLDEIWGWQATFLALLLAGLGVLALTWADLGETSTPRDVSLMDQFRQYPELFRSRRFWGYALTAALSSGAFFAYLGGAPFVGSHVFALSPSVLGLYFGIVAVGYMTGNFISGRYSVRVGINGMIYWGALITLAAPLLSMAFFAAGATQPIAFFGAMALLGVGNGMVLPNAIAGTLSVRPHLAGTASGLGGAIMIGGGAAFSALAGALLKPGTGAWPLLLIMATTSALAVVSVLYVRWVDRRAGPILAMPPKDGA
ncbi:multidrug effflux MFS transporter [Rhodovulum sulfidophilum]|uniref:multidrug effflux MFS transporter n=1 Tax=Rhodovulum sulfidophilum TaxID=35806 RepID=UPI000951A5D4|nr:multidrug effflux MFS transporter [Rhodovulum sulfidophilum]MBL3550659.1 multidrug effflux MFS transporter [Rhodovulum sulfidophilum]NDK33570.1 multidrug effflux MFS transporter [Rhodovulum sulfidophilum]OLS48765.1 Bcr/CflA family drug resistance efflux transporter [Rhodovulum sulfidophilum]